MVQAALNAMASSASADPMEASSTSLTPTTPLAAAVILQVSYQASCAPGFSRWACVSFVHAVGVCFFLCANTS